ncbi:hypothetical protein PspLS_04497 [Pyricularia sp. CBS 133598]|nr:hypothetical protein PspLS_04497 [Pyricularia sp. CBS 133598]
MHTIHHPVQAKPQNQPTDRHREALNCAARSSFITGAWRATCTAAQSVLGNQSAHLARLGTLSHCSTYIESDKPYFVRIARALELYFFFEKPPPRLNISKSIASSSMHDLKTGPGLYLVAAHASPSQIGPVSSCPGARQRHQVHARVRQSSHMRMQCR